MKTAYIGLGSNLGNSLLVLQRAWAALGERPEINPLRLSSPYRTEPVGMDSRHWFVNAAGSVTTSLAPRELLRVLLAVEGEFGRVRDPALPGYRDRILDFDLLFYGDLVMDQGDLVLPHPEIERRLFVLHPLCEIAAEFVHPVLGITVRDLLLDLQNRVTPAPAVVKISWTEGGDHSAGTRLGHAG